MNYIYILIVTTLVVPDRYVLPQKDPTQVTPTTNPHEYPDLLQGHCSSAKDSDMVYHEVVKGAAIPLFSRNLTSRWYGDEKLYCIKAINEYNKMNKKGGGTVVLKEGGAGHHFVTLEMHSEKGGALNFLVFLYGKKVKINH